MWHKIKVSVRFQKFSKNSLIKKSALRVVVKREHKRFPAPLIPMGRYLSPYHPRIVMFYIGLVIDELRDRLLTLRSV
jgi:hypothetical protein